MERVATLCRQARSGAYFVKRGAIDWSAFPFDERPRAMSVIMDEHTLGDVNGIKTGTMSIEAFARMTDATITQVDDALQDEIVEDVTSVIETLMTETDSQGDNVVFRVAADARIVEAHDADLRVQGVVATFNVAF